MQYEYEGFKLNKKLNSQSLDTGHRIDTSEMYNIQAINNTTICDNSHVRIDGMSICREVSGSYNDNIRVTVLAYMLYLSEKYKKKESREKYKGNKRITHYNKKY